MESSDLKIVNYLIKSDLKAMEILETASWLTQSPQLRTGKT